MHYVLALLLLSTAAQADSLSSLPFWTEKSIWRESHYIMAVGIASDAKSQEEGRFTAFDNGVKEIKNAVPALEAYELRVDTQMTFTVQNKSGTYTIYRLLKLDVDNPIVEHAMTEQVEKPKQEPEPVVKEQINSIPRTKDCTHTIHYNGIGDILVKDPC